MDINVSQMESQDIIKVVLTQPTTYTNVSLRVIIIQLFFIVRKEKNIEITNTNDNDDNQL